MMHYYYGFSPLGMGLGGLLAGFLMLLFWVLVAMAIVAVMRSMSGHRHHHGFMGDVPPHHEPSEPGKAPLDILKERYAKGEIDKKQFEEMKKDLND